MADKIKRVNVSSEKFLKIVGQAYNEGGDLNTVAEKTGLKFDTVYIRYNQWKKRLADAGVTIPPMGTGKTRGQKLDVASLAAQFKAEFAAVGIPQPKLPETK